MQAARCRGPGEWLQTLQQHHRHSACPGSALHLSAMRPPRSTSTASQPGRNWRWCVTSSRVLPAWVGGGRREGAGLIVCTQGGGRPRGPSHSIDPTAGAAWAPAAHPPSRHCCRCSGQTGCGRRAGPPQTAGRPAAAGEGQGGEARSETGTAAAAAAARRVRWQSNPAVAEGGGRQHLRLL